MIVAKCDMCGKDISWKMAEITQNRFKKNLCIIDQVDEITKTYPPKLAKFTIDNLKKQFPFI